MPPPKRPPADVDGPVVAAVRRDLATLPTDLATSSLAASALVMAQGLDDAGASLTSKTLAQARLQGAIDRLRELAPPKQEVADGVDDIAKFRERRLAAARSSARTD
jgi:hypothetical protein